ncbi:TBC1 domain family member 5 isoform X2 [Denticeps clupeoides]|uniref:TBC1 domain family member 5 n=2 Tax=Denticeps clupeoides TaxID=299321 RepID=A0AAY4BUB9_9TELE|nr:TBC1 domain family member 5 isoform X2 [Denticeps clupeoides]XP_028847812.1 TBC1 domain family member 5 isoform X2 [Denticeps clupeoides]XP_028847813.1 TBC1 domain family member 5 isoform X2 [Denticeps clupeoides]
MQHPNFETRHPLQTDEQETGYDPLQNINRIHGAATESSAGSESTYLSYRKEWDQLFQNSNYLPQVRQAGINGLLRSSRFRSVCWKLYLDVLPEDKSHWIRKTKEFRAQYEKIKDMHITNPRKAAGQQDLLVNNPLSQDEGSLWNKFFQDKELRGMIKQDVMRTFPEMKYFQEDNVRTKLTDILFCYARENQQLLYKQGMHELLAPIVFVLHCDHQAFQHASETAHPSEEMKVLLSPEYHEHDAYAMFSQLMETAEPWFSSFEREVRKGKEEMITSMPFARPQDVGPSVAIVTKVNRIQEQLVKKHDIELHMHLNRLEIAPQIYGIRWVRLLFGREFPLQDLLVVWDALFADSLALDLVDYVFVAMLLYIRDALIASNFQTCLGLLMHYPSIGDVHALLQKALFIRDPKNNPRPVNYQFQQNLQFSRTQGAELISKTRSNSKAAPLNINKVSSSLLSLGRKLIGPAMSGGAPGISPINSDVLSTPSTQATMRQSGESAATGPAPSQTPTPTPAQRLLKSESMPVHLSKDVGSCGGSQVSLPAQILSETPGHTPRTMSSSPSSESVSSGRDHTMSSPPLPVSRGRDSAASSPPLSASKKDSFFNISRSRSHSKTMSRRDTEELEAQVSFLQGQINDLEAMSKYCAKMMNIHIGKIQDVILQERLQKEDEVLVSLAGLKQIKDILKGALRFNQSQLESEENEEITIADDHYCSNALTLTYARSRSSQEPKTEASRIGQQGFDRRNWDDYILVSQDGDLQQADNQAPPPGPSFHDPLIGTTSGSSSPDEGSTHSKDSDFTIVNPTDL